MKRAFLYVVLPLTLFALVLIAIVNLNAAGEKLSPPDLSLAITLPDGRVEPLGELLVRLRAVRTEECSHADSEAVEPTETEAPLGTSRSSVVRAAESIAVEGDLQALFTWPLPVDETDLFSLGFYALRENRFDEAMALFQSVGPLDEDYARAQRFIGWELLTKQMDRPERGVAYLNRALRRGPLDGENWQDASRVYLRTLGIRWDPVSNRMR